MKKMVVACIFLALTSGMGFAQTASREKVLEMMDAMHSKQMMQKMAEMMKAQVLTTVLEEAKANPKQQMTPPQIDKLRNFVNDTYSPKIMDQLISAMVPIYQKHFTDAEISDIIAFNNSPTGQKVQAEQPKIMMDYMSAIQPLMKTMMADMKQKAEERAKASAAAR